MSGKSCWFSSARSPAPDGRKRPPTMPRVNRRTAAPALCPQNSSAVEFFGPAPTIMHQGTVSMASPEQPAGRWSRLKTTAGQWSLPVLIVLVGGGYWLYRSVFAVDHRDELP